MDEETITALAKGLMPVVRETIAEALVPVAARLAGFEARPMERGEPGPQGPAGERGADGSAGPPGAVGERGESGAEAMLPPDLAEHVASAARLLHELPPIAVRDAPPPVRVMRIERDENGALVPIYDESKS
jgi:hypothetical protein